MVVGHAGSSCNMLKYTISHIAVFDFLHVLHVFNSCKVCSGKQSLCTLLETPKYMKYMKILPFVLPVKYRVNHVSDCVITLQIHRISHYC